MNLKTKIHIGTASLVLVVVAGMMSSLYISEKKQLWEEIHQEQKEDLAKLGRVYKEHKLFENQLILLNYVTTLVTSDKVDYAGFVDRDGTGWVYAGSKKDLIFSKPNDPATQAILESRKLRRFEKVNSEGHPVIEMTRPVERAGYVRLGYSKKEVNRLVEARLALVLKKLMGVGFISIALGLLLAHLLSRALSKPIFNLMKAAKAIASGEKGVTIPEGGKDELGRLTRTFNNMSIELAKLDELKDDFMSHVTHELRSPLTSIIATVELMDEMPMANANSKIRRSIDRLKYGSERLNKLVDNILDLTRMEAGKMHFDIKPLDIGTLVCEMADFFEPRAMEKSLTIKAKAPRSLPMALGDPEKIRQILSNLIHNAVKFTNEGSITLWVKQRDEKIHVGVTDTGIGIPKEKLNTVFSKFECLQDSRDRVSKAVQGSGLGLNIVMNSIKAQNGRIWVESEVDKGTTFTFSLPIAKGEAHLPPQTPKSKIVKAPAANKDEKGIHQPVMMKKKEKTA